MAASEKSPTVVVIGLGNELLRDEGVGIHAVEAMQAMQLPEQVEVLDGGTSGADLIDEIADRPKVIVIDAVKADCKAGTVFRFSADDLMNEGGRTISLHEFGLVETLIAARHLGCAPQQVVIFGIQPKQFTPGLELSQEVAEVLPKVIEQVLNEAQS